MLKVKDKISLIDRLLNSKEKILCYGVERIGIFGSFVRNEMRADSDVDFFVEFKEGYKNYDNFMELAFFLKELTGREIELVTPNSLSPFIGPEIMKEVSYVIASEKKRQSFCAFIAAG
jgi:predicted nucleotidyltransferase